MDARILYKISTVRSSSGESITHSQFSSFVIFQVTHCQAKPRVAKPMHEFDQKHEEVRDVAGCLAKL